MACAPSEDSDQSGHPASLIRVFAVRMKKAGILSYPWVHKGDSDQMADAQADLSLHWVHRSFCWFCRAVTHLFLSFPSLTLKGGDVSVGRALKSNDRMRSTPLCGRSRRGKGELKLSPPSTTYSFLMEVGYISNIPSNWSTPENASLNS